MTATGSAPSARSQARSERILLFIPAYNCEKQIPRVLAQLTAEARSLLSEVIVVNNRSTDGTQAAAIKAMEALAPQLPAKVLLNRENYGLGGSHKVAFNYAIDQAFDYCIVLHGDDQGGVGDLLPLIRAGAHRKTDCLLGARFMPGSRLSGYSFTRMLGNHVFNLLYSAAARTRIYDLGSGLNLYSVKALANRSYLRHANDLTFNYHMILNSIAEGHRIEFFPIEWREADQISNVKIFRQTLQVTKIVSEFATRRGQYLAADHSGRASAAYPSDTVFDNIAGKSAS